jgi:phage terminase small subunit
VIDDDLPALSPEEGRFVDALIRSPTLDRTAAARHAWGLKPGTPSWDAATARAWKAYNKPEVQAELKRRRGYIEAATDAQATQLEHALARIAFADLREIEADDGSPRRLRDIPDDLALALAGVKLKTTHRGSGDKAEVIEEREFKLADRQQAIQTLLRRRGLIKDDQAGSGVTVRFDLHLG